MIKYLKLLLWPFSLVYGAVTALRNLLFDKGILKQTHFEMPVIAVGNLTVGGTGKTPHIEYLLRLLSRYKLATLSRGYKRKTKGFILANEQSTAAELGDESFQYHKDFSGLTVAVCEDRVKGVETLTHLQPETDIVLLDDAMQHRAIKPSLMIMLTDYGRPFFSDFILPAGLLRESKRGAKRADIVVVSKCPQQMSAPEMDRFKARISKYTLPHTPVYFSAFKYGHPVSIGVNSNVSKNIILLTGIANPVPLQQYLSAQGFTILKSQTYPDHHKYTSQDMVALQETLEQTKSPDVSIITTSKDAVKLTEDGIDDITRRLPVFYLPIEVVFLNGGQEFDFSVLQHVEQMLPASRN